MRVLLDTNILISFLLAGQYESAIAQVVRAGFRGEYRLLVTEELFDEVVTTVQQKRHLTHRISPADVKRLASLLSQVAEPIPRITERMPAIVRDPQDDYLLAYALIGRADYLVTGDRDLLVLRQAGDTAIVTPAEFWRILSAGLLR